MELSLRGEERLLNTLMNVKSVQIKETVFPFYVDMLTSSVWAQFTRLTVFSPTFLTKSKLPSLGVQLVKLNKYQLVKDYFYFKR